METAAAAAGQVWRSLMNGWAKRGPVVSSPSDSRSGGQTSMGGIYSMYIHSLSLPGREGGEWTE